MERAESPPSHAAAASPFVRASPLTSRPGSPLKSQFSCGGARTPVTTPSLTPVDTAHASPGSASFHTAASPAEFPSPSTDVASALPDRAPSAKSPLGPIAAVGQSPSAAQRDAQAFTPLLTEPPCPAALRVHCLTYNMGRIKPSRGFLASLPPACFGDGGASAAPPDVLVIATQENDSASQWISLLSELLAPRGYALPYGGASVNSAPGGSFFMTVALFVRRPLQALTSDVRVGRVTCGMGNKV